MVPRIALASFAFVIAATAAPLAGAWQPHQYETDGFVVEFSSAVKVSPLKVSETTRAKVVRATSYSQDGAGAYVYLVGASLFKDGAQFDFTSGVANTIRAYRCRAIDGDTTTKQIGNTVREIRASQCMNGTVRVGARFVLARPWFYQVVYLVSTDAGMNDAEHFLRSFKLTRR